MKQILIFSFLFSFNLLSAEIKIESFLDHEGFVYLDGGSTGFAFQIEEKGNEKKEFLILDRAMVPIKFNEEGKPIKYKPKEDGLLYWTKDNFEKKIPLELESKLSKDLLQAILKWLEDSEFEGNLMQMKEENSRLFRVIQILESSTANKAVDVTATRSASSSTSL